MSEPFGILLWKKPSLESDVWSKMKQQPLWYYGYCYLHEKEVRIHAKMQSNSLGMSNASTSSEHSVPSANGILYYPVRNWYQITAKCESLHMFFRRIEKISGRYSIGQNEDDWSSHGTFWERYCWLDSLPEKHGKPGLNSFLGLLALAASPLKKRTSPVGHFTTRKERHYQHFPDWDDTNDGIKFLQNITYLTPQSGREEKLQNKEGITMASPNYCSSYGIILLGPAGLRLLGSHASSSFSIQSLVGWKEEYVSIMCWNWSTIGPRSVVTQDAWYGIATEKRTTHWVNSLRFSANQSKKSLSEPYSILNMVWGTLNPPLVEEFLNNQEAFLC